MTLSNSCLANTELLKDVFSNQGATLKDVQ